MKNSFGILLLKYVGLNMQYTKHHFNNFIIMNYWVIKLQNVNA